MLAALTVILILLILIMGGDRTAKSLVALFINAFLLLGALLLITKGVNPFAVSIAGCLAISLVTLLYQNDITAKTKVAFVSVMFVIGILMVLVWVIVPEANIQGFPIDQLDIRDSNGYSRNIDRDMVLIQIFVVFMLLMGAVTDTALAITSAVYEVKENNPGITVGRLFLSGISIGRSILSSTMNTLFFIYIAEYLTLFIQFTQDYSLLEMVNSKQFCQEFIAIAISGIGCILVIPISSALCGWHYRNNGL